MRAGRTEENKIIKEVQERMEILKRDAIRTISASPEGRIFLNILMTECGFHRPSLVQQYQTGEINEKALIVNEAIRGLYLRIRSMIPEKHLKEIEFLDLRNAAKDIVMANREENEKC